MNPNQYSNHVQNPSSSPNQGYVTPGFLNGTSMNNMNNMNNMMGGLSGINMNMNAMNSMGGMGGMGGMAGMGGNMGGGMGGNMGGMGGSMGNMGMGGGMGSMNSMGMGNMGGMGGNMNPMSMANMGGMRPQGNINPAQLMGMSGAGGGGSGGMGGMGMSPTQLLQQQQRMSNMGQAGMSGMASMNPMSSNNMMTNSLNPMSMNQGNMSNMGNMAGMGNMTSLGQNPMQNSMNQGNIGSNMASMASNYQNSGPSSLSSPTTEPIARPGTSMSMHSNSGGGGYPGQGMGNMGGSSMNMGSMGGGMPGGMNVSSPSSSQGHPQASSHPQNIQSHGSQTLHGQPHGQQHSPSGPQSGPPFQGGMPNAQTQAMLASAIGHLGYSNEQFRGLPLNERHLVLQRAWPLVNERLRSLQASSQATSMGGMSGQGHGGPTGQGGMQAIQSNQGQMHIQNLQQHSLHERPPSSASTHSQHEMMPPPPRPGTSMSMSRPGTAMGMGPPPGSRPGTSQGPGQPGMGGPGRTVSGSGGPSSTGRGSVPPGSPNMSGGDGLYSQPPQTPTNQSQITPTPKMGSGSTASSPTRSTMPQTPMQQNNSMPQIPVNGMVTAGMTPQGMIQNMLGRSGSASSLMGANPMGMGGMNTQGSMNAHSPMSQGPPAMQRHGSMPAPQTLQTPTHPQAPQLSNQTPQRNQTPHPPNQRQSSLPPQGSAGKMPPNRMTLPMPGSNLGGGISNMSNPSMESLNSLNSGDQVNGPQPNGQIPMVKQGSVPPPATPTMSQPSSNQTNASQTVPTNTASQVPNILAQPTTSQSTQPNQNDAQAAPSNAPVQTRLQPPPPLPSSVSLNPAITRVTAIAVVGSDKSIPQLSQEEIENIQNWIKIDEAYEGTVIREGKDGVKEKELGIWRKQKERMAREMRTSFGHVAPGAPPIPAADGLDRAALNAGAWWERGGVTHGKWFNPTWEWWETRYAGVSGRPVEKRFDVRYPGQWARHVKQKDAQQGVNQANFRGRHGRDAGGKDTKAVRREGLRVPRKLKPEDVDMPEELVPIRLEFDVDHHKMRDTFVWNLNDPVVSPESFAQSLVEDYGLASSYNSQIVKQIQDQLNDYKAHSAKYTEGGDPLPVPPHELEMAVCKGAIEKEESKWWQGWRKRLRGEENQKERKRRKIFNRTEDANDGDDENEGIMMVKNRVPMGVEEMKVDETAIRDDLRILIKIDIIVGSVKLDDQFEWDIDNISSSPELFAEIYAQDLGLSGEFKTAIAHSIREQVQTYQKSLYLVGRPTDGSPIQDEDLRQSFLPALSEAARAYEQVVNFTPRLDYLSDGELDRNEKERDKDYKRRKRNTRGRRGVNLPDREPIRTCRTPAIGFNDTGEAEVNASANTGIMPSTTRRAAAAAASLTIANMVASENGSSPIMGQAMLPGQVPSLVSTPQPQQPPPPPPPKKPIPKGLYKPPPVPSEVLKSRAKVPAPTPSTAVDGTNISSGVAESSMSISTGMGAPKGKAIVISAKRAKELEREAKEKEFADGQHANHIDGVWHCSNCGCPESIAVGRRKGPLGDKSQCGTCGKYWHRHRRPRPVEYNTDPDFHLNQRDSEVLSKSVLTAPRRKGRPPGSAANASAAATPEPATPLTRRRDLAMSDRETPSRRQSPPVSRKQTPPARAVSPALSSTSSASESPLALKVNGNTPARVCTSPKPPLPNSNSAISPRPSLSETQDAPSSEVKEEETAPASAPSSTSGARAWPPEWLTDMMQTKQSKYPNDHFEVVLRKMAPGLEAEWRIKCIDCPGKLYKPGPGETLSNFEMHLTNRKHRQRVDERVKEDDA